VPATSPHQASVVVVARDPALAAALELALQAAGLNAIVYDPAQGLDDLPLDGVAALIADDEVLTPSPAAFVTQLRARPWEGLTILMTGNGEKLRAAFEGSWGIAVLEMPFVGAEMIAAIRAAWPADDDPAPGS
jgi:FixJ family two-component response regulator